MIVFKNQSFILQFMYSPNLNPKLREKSDEIQAPMITLLGTERNKQSDTKYDNVVDLFKVVIEPLINKNCQ